MNPSWAVFRKELRTESRARNGFFTAGMFSVLAVVAIGLSSFGQRPSESLAAGMLSVTLLFSAVVALPRTFLVEEEQGTFSLLRLMASPEAIFTGKALYNFFQMLLTSVVLGVLFSGLVGRPVEVAWLYGLGLGVQAASLSSAMSLCSAMVMGASNRWILAGAMAAALLLPQIALGVGLFRVCFGEGSLVGGIQCLVGLAGYAVALGGLGPVLAGAVWRSE